MGEGFDCDNCCFNRFIKETTLFASCDIFTFLCVQWLKVRLGLNLFTYMVSKVIMKEFIFICGKVNSAACTKALSMLRQPMNHLF
jgi:hypothetical protein